MNFRILFGLLALVGLGSALAIAQEIRGSGTNSSSSGSNVNLVGINGSVPVTGSGTATGALRVELPTNGTGVVGLNAGTNSIGSVAQVASPVALGPNGASGAALANVQTSAVATSLTLKSSAGNLYGVQATVGATSGYLMLVDSATLPAASGAVTPKLCLAVGTTSTVGFQAPGGVPVRFGSGIQAVFSTNGCFLLAAGSATAFLSGQVQ